MGGCVSQIKKEIIKNPQQSQPIPTLVQKTLPPNIQNHLTQPKKMETISKAPQQTQQKTNPIEGKYRNTLKQEVFAYVSDLPNSLYKKGNNSAKIIRLSKQVVKFAQFLPCEHTNAIFVRCDQANMDSMNILISGSTGTPYANGLYHFELYCDESYPYNPPKMQLLTGKNKVRFNPNLYQNGYICLSLLGTWAGQGCETWNPLKSSLIQIFVSIQSLIMNNDIHFNEPGYEQSKNTTQGDLFNVGYSNVVKIANIRHAMIEIMRKPPKGFEKVVREHFLIKKEEILEECAEWMRQKDKPYWNPGQNPNYQNIILKDKYGVLLGKQIQQLKNAFIDLEKL